GRWVRLSPLWRGAVEQLAEPRDLDPDELSRKTGGNPFFVVEAIAASADEIPDTVRDAVFARAARLSAPAKEVLEAVAVVPPHAELRLLEALVGDAIQALNECLAAGVLATGPNATAFPH